MTDRSIDQEQGVSDIRPIRARNLFVKALAAEAEGRSDQAMTFLEQAVEAAKE
jgi:hypothetical protein